MDDKPLTATDTESVIQRAMDHVAEVESFEAEIRRNIREDVKFLRELDQWHEADKAARSKPGEQRPIIVADQITQYRNRVVNDLIKNTPGMKVRPVRNGSKEVAELHMGHFRHISAVSRADSRFDNAIQWAVDGGLGYFRILTDYVSPKSWEQEILIGLLPDPLKVFFDPMSVEIDGSDAKRCAIVEDVRRKVFEREHGEVMPWSGGEAVNDWNTADTVRVAEYFEIHEQKATLVLLADGRSEWEEDLSDEDQAFIVDSRTEQRKVCKWWKLGGDKILDKSELKTSYIPVIPVYGNMWVMDGQRYVSGFVRNAKDPQRAYNYWRSAEVEYLANLNKAPYVVPSEAITGHEKVWSKANKAALPYLPYNAFDSRGQAINRPTREPPPQPPQGFLAAIEGARDDIKSALGMQDPTVGKSDHEQSGVALGKLKSNADAGNYHFTDHLGKSVSHAARICLELTPSVIDTKRLIRVFGEDGKSREVMVDPNQAEPVLEHDDGNGGRYKTYNLSAGSYDLVADYGPSYATKQEEVAERMMDFAGRVPEIMSVAGDIVVDSFGLPDDRLQKRLKKTINPNLLEPEEGEEQNELEKLRQQLAQLQQQNTQMQEALQQVDFAKAQKAEAEAMALMQQQAREDRKLLMEAEEKDARFRQETEFEYQRLDLEYQKLNLDLQRLLLEADPADQVREDEFKVAEHLRIVEDQRRTDEIHQIELAIKAKEVELKAAEVALKNKELKQPAKPKGEAKPKSKVA